MNLHAIEASSRLIQAARLLGGRYLQPHDDEALIILPDARTVRFWSDPTDGLRYAELVWPWPGQRPAPVYLPESASANETARAVAWLAARTAAYWDQYANQPENT